MIHRILLFLLGTFAIAGCGGPKLSPQQAAARFFELCATGQSAAAYQSATQMFQLERTQKYFEARVRDLGLDDVKSVNWKDPEPRDETQLVRGEFKLGGDRALNLLVTMAKENGEWRLLEATRNDRDGEDVFAVIARSSDSEAERNKSFVEPVATAMPSERHLQQLVEKTLLDFNDAIKRADFNDFFAGVSDRWKYRGKDPRVLSYTGTDPRRLQEADPMNTAQRLTVEALRSAFQPFVDAKVDLSSIKGKPMVLDRPAHVTSDGVLTLSGTYNDFVFQGGFNAQPRRLVFKLEYVFEGSSWRLFGITANVQPPEAKKNGP